MTDDRALSVALDVGLRRAIPFEQGDACFPWVDGHQDFLQDSPFEEREWVAPRRSDTSPTLRVAA